MSEQIRNGWTLQALRGIRDEINAIAKKNGAFDVRVFGSIARDEAHENSDIDFLVSFEAGRSIFDQVGLWLDLQDLLGCEVDLLTDHPDAGKVTQIAREEAVPL